MWVLWGGDSDFEKPMISLEKNLNSGFATSPMNGSGIKRNIRALQNSNQLIHPVKKHRSRKGKEWVELSKEAQGTKEQ